MALMNAGAAQLLPEAEFDEVFLAYLLYDGVPGYVVWFAVEPSITLSPEWWELHNKDIFEECDRSLLVALAVIWLAGVGYKCLPMVP